MDETRVRHKSQEPNFFFICSVPGIRVSDPLFVRICSLMLRHISLHQILRQWNLGRPNKDP